MIVKIGQRVQANRTVKGCSALSLQKWHLMYLVSRQRVFAGSNPFCPPPLRLSQRERVHEDLGADLGRVRRAQAKLEWSRSADSHLGTGVSVSRQKRLEWPLVFTGAKC